MRTSGLERLTWATAPRGDLHTSTHLHSVKVRTGCEGWECEWYRMRRSAPKGRSRVSRYDPAKCLNSPKPRVKLPFWLCSSTPRTRRSHPANVKLRSDGLYLARAPYENPCNDVVKWFSSKIYCKIFAG